MTTPALSVQIKTEKALVPEGRVATNAVMDSYLSRAQLYAGAPTVDDIELAVRAGAVGYVRLRNAAHANALYLRLKQDEALEVRLDGYIVQFWPKIYTNIQRFYVCQIRPEPKELVGIVYAEDRALARDLVAAHAGFIKRSALTSKIEYDTLGAYMQSIQMIINGDPTITPHRWRCEPVTRGDNWEEVFRE